MKPMKLHYMALFSALAVMVGIWVTPMAAQNPEPTIERLKFEILQLQDQLSIESRFRAALQRENAWLSEQVKALKEQRENGKSEN